MVKVHCIEVQVSRKGLEELSERTKDDAEVICNPGISRDAEVHLEKHKIR